jgi:hypothetical protein
MLPPLRQRMLEDRARLPNPATLRHLREALRAFPEALTSVRESWIPEGAEAPCGTNREWCATAECILLPLGLTNMLIDELRFRLQAQQRLGHPQARCTDGHSRTCRLGRATEWRFANTLQRTIQGLGN